MKKRKRITRGMNRINEILEMPAEVVSDTPKISILGFEEMLIENYKNIIEYESFYIKVNTHIGVINVNGFNLNLIQMNQDDMKITGKIDSIEFENYEERILSENVWTFIPKQVSEGLSDVSEKCGQLDSLADIFRERGLKCTPPCEGVREVRKWQSRRRLRSRRREKSRWNSMCWSRRG